MPLLSRKKLYFCFDDRVCLMVTDQKKPLSSSCPLTAEGRDPNQLSKRSSYLGNSPQQWNPVAKIPMVSPVQPNSNPTPSSQWLLCRPLTTRPLGLTLHCYSVGLFMFTFETQKLTTRNSVSGIIFLDLGHPSGVTKIPLLHCLLLEDFSDDTVQP